MMLPGEIVFSWSESDKNSILIFKRHRYHYRFRMMCTDLFTSCYLIRRLITLIRDDSPGVLDQ